MLFTGLHRSAATCELSSSRSGTDDQAGFELGRRYFASLWRCWRGFAMLGMFSGIEPQDVLALT